MNLLLFDYTKTKNKKNLWRTMALIFLSILVLNGVIFSIYTTLKSIDRNILDSHRLSLIVFSGYDDEGNNYPYDIEKFRDLEHVEFVSKTQGFLLT